MVVELNESNFDEEVLRAGKPVVVQFWAEWSSCCREMLPLIDSFAEDRCSDVKVGRVNVEQHQSLADQYGIRAVPTVLFFSRGGVHDQIVGQTNVLEVRDRLRHFA